MDADRIRVCIIGGGPSGLMAIRGLQKSVDEGLVEVVCYEKNDDIGGQWFFTGQEEPDESGLEPSSSMYYNLRVNTPKEGSNELPEFLFPENDPSYPERPYMLDYLTKFAAHFNLKSCIKFKSWVDSVKNSEDERKFLVTVRSLDDKPTETVSEVFDYVIVATGHYSYPNIVAYPGQETFPGIILHSKYFIDAKRYTGKRVLLVGSRLSAEDISLQLIRVGATHVTISYRTKPTGLKFPQGIDEKPILERIENDTIRFSDGTSDRYDVIIYCTGYLYLFPFLEEKDRLVTVNGFCPPLYKLIVYPRNPRLFYMGMLVALYNFPLFWLQGKFCARVIRGEVSLPTGEEMEMIVEEEVKRSKVEVKSLADAVGYQKKYIDELAELTNSEKLDGVDAIFCKFLEHRQHDVATYKSNNFSSIYRPEKTVSSLSD